MDYIKVGQGLGLERGYYRGKIEFYEEWIEKRHPKFSLIAWLLVLILKLWKYLWTHFFNLFLSFFLKQTY